MPDVTTCPNCERLARINSELLEALRLAEHCLIQLTPYPPEVSEGVVAIVGMTRATIANANAAGRGTT